MRINFSNLILTNDNEFKFVDFRQDFAGIIEYGDQYYDFAKLWAGLCFIHTSVKNGKYIIKEDERRVKTWIEVPIEIERCKNIFEDFYTMFL